MTRAALPVFLALFILTTQSGCRVIGLGGGGRGEFISDEQPTKLAPRFVTRVFDSADGNTADIVLSDLDRETLRDRDAMDSAVGQVIHARMFITPKAGRTPIEPTACTVTLRYIVLTGGEYGIYAGGGFLLPGDRPTGRRFKGRILNATMRLVSSSAGFKDLVGSGRMSLSFTARRDAETVRRATRNGDFLAFSAIPVPDYPLLSVDE
ncbi:MAG TPA: hypothetical protein ENK11_05245 [Phycisphaerales bacterium]|nr:hypothetical protein [Phycisphaerales bacterium]